MIINSALFFDKIYGYRFRKAGWKMKRRYKWLRILAALVVLAAFAAGIMAYLI